MTAGYFRSSDSLLPARTLFAAMAKQWQSILFVSSDKRQDNFQDVPQQVAAWLDKISDRIVETRSVPDSVKLSTGAFGHDVPYDVIGSYVFLEGGLVWLQVQHWKNKSLVYVCKSKDHEAPEKSLWHNCTAIGQPEPVDPPEEENSQETKKKPKKRPASGSVMRRPAAAASNKKSNSKSGQAPDASQVE